MYRPSAEDFALEDERRQSQSYIPSMNAQPMLKGQYKPTAKDFAQEDARRQSNNAANQPEQSFANKYYRNVGAGLLEGGRHALNIPHQLKELLQSSTGGFPFNQAPYFEPTDFHKMMGLTGEPTTSDSVIQGLSSLIPAALAAPEATLGRAGSAGYSALKSIPRAYNALRNPFKATKQYGNELEEAQHAQQQAEYTGDILGARQEQLKNYIEMLKQGMTRNAGSSNIGRVQNKVGEAQTAQANARARLAEIPNEQTENVLTQLHDPNVFPNMQNQAQTLEDTLAGLLGKTVGGKKLSHESMVGTQTAPVLEDFISGVTKGYKTITSDLADKNVFMPKAGSSSKQIEQIKTLLDHQLKTSNNLETPVVKELRQELDKVSGSGDVIPAKDFFSLYKAARQTSYRLRAKANENGSNLTSAERDNMIKEADHYLEQSEKMKPLLDEVMGKDNAELLAETNKAFSKQVAPLWRNPHYWKIREEQTIPSNFLEKINSGASGNSTLRKLIQENPEISRLSIGQKFSAKPASIHESDVLYNPYIDRVPDLKATIMRHKGALENVAKAEEYNTAGNVKRANEAETLKTRINQRTEREKLSAEMAKHEDYISKAQNELPRLEKTLQDESLNDTARVQNAKRIRELKENTKQARTKYKEAKAKRDYLIKWGAVGLAGSVGIPYVKKLISSFMQL